MCNFLHENYTEAKRKTGIGYKLFRLCDLNMSRKKDFLTNLANFSVRGVTYKVYTLKKGDYLEWDESFVSKNHALSGFCFFLTKRDVKKAARLCSKNWVGRIVCFRIRYEGCIGKQREGNMFMNETINMALCRKFTVLEKEEF